ncbi:hypothetical protein BRADI_1g17766v3 [Brachypodium distachyon]|uniref:Uncharacterized protein n=1 Tax=Brachypodium distachyon TaxID=15368 RepID=A0A0Q3GW40_BRADI|nr:hypothetical protein BRADI_1g17766v3 [Brachypodium distachyon]
MLGYRYLKHWDKVRYTMSNQPRRRPTKSQSENENSVFLLLTLSNFLHDDVISDSSMRVHVGYDHDRAALQDITNGCAQSINSAQGTF